MSVESLTNRGEYLSAHYLAEILPTTLKGSDLVKRWSTAEKDGEQTPRTRLRALRRAYFDAKTELADEAFFDPERLRKLHQEVLRALGFDPRPQTVTVTRAGQDQQLDVAHAEPTTAHGIVALDCGWAVDTEAAQDPDAAGRLLDPVTLAGTETIATGAKLASWLFATENPPRYVLLLHGGVVTLADRSAWGEGRYLAVNLDTLYARNDDKEYDVVAALFGADSLRPPAEGGTEPLADLVAGSRQHAVGVSGELREGLKVSVELIANEVLDRIRQAGHQPEDVMELDELARELGREALRYLYRILFLLYAEARPELGVLPVNDRDYVDGYSLARLGDLVARRLAPSAESGFHLYESLDLLFRMVNEGHRPRGGATVDDHASEGEGLRFEPMKSELFLPERTRLIGRLIPRPDCDDPDDPDAPTIDTRLRNKVLYQVLRRLMLTRGGKKRRGGFISYAQLGINQLGAVYEGLMSYTGFVARERLYEVARNGDPKDGSWMIPAAKHDEYDDSVFVYKENPYTGLRSQVSYEPGQFVWRLAGRDRQTSASYYTPQSLTEVTVQLALKYRLDQDDTVTPARELLDWTICEPALGSGAFLNEAINQVAAEYLRRRQKELAVTLDPEDYHLELQRVKAYIALHNCYGVDLNRTAVELAEVSLWLNVMHAGLQAPWFGLHLQRGNSLIGCGRKTYDPKQLADKSWLTTAPAEKPFRDGDIDAGTIHHFLLPADGWGAVAGEKEARELAPAETAKLKTWRTAMRRTPSAKGRNSQVVRLQALARRVEFLWGLVRQRLRISEQEIRRAIPVWGADDLPPVTQAVAREKILADLTATGTPYWRLKTLMDVWCALWFWPLDSVGLLDGSDPAYRGLQVKRVLEESPRAAPRVVQKQDIFGGVEEQEVKPQTWTGTRKATVIETLRQQVPLASLDDWLTFAEALIGRRDANEGQPDLLGTFRTLTEMTEYEQKLDGVIGVDPLNVLSDRFPWLIAAEGIAEEQGFFHWELTFAQAFANGGFDLQVGNPPWVRPRWDAAGVLAEFDPWFKLTEKPNARARSDRTEAVLINSLAVASLKKERERISAMVAIYGSVQAFPLLVGTQPDLYRCFMCRVWDNSARSGAVGLIHPDTHFIGEKEVLLRAVAYSRLRVHGDFVNPGHRFFPEPVGESSHFGVHVYGSPGEINFDHLSWLFSVEALRLSFEHDGSGDPPSIRFNGVLDERPHRARIIRVDRQVLAQWQRLAGDIGRPVEHARLLFPVSTAEGSAIRALSNWSTRLESHLPQISRGFDEAGAKRAGLMDYALSEPGDWSEVILKGPQLGVATPFFKGPNPGSNDVLGANLVELPQDAVPATEYRRLVGLQDYRDQHDRWCDYELFDRLRGSENEVEKGRAVLARSLGCRPEEVPDSEIENYLRGRALRRYTDFFRLAWRERIAPDTERSLYAAILPPGPAHVNAVRTASLRNRRLTCLVAGFWASIPVDYLLRVLGVGHLDVSNARRMLAPSIPHPLANALLLRTLRLNCLTRAYSELWNGLYVDVFRDEEWALEWDGLKALGSVGPQWEYSTPLRTEKERRAALVELDALVAVWLGVDADSLIAMYRSRFPVMGRFEDGTWFDFNGWKIAENHRAHGQRQQREHFAQLQAHLSSPDNEPAPDGFVGPFCKADREWEMREAHKEFKIRLDSV